ncbi:MAG: alpha/beta hydrolase [Planctomycetales bacterium]
MPDLSSPDRCLVGFRVLSFLGGLGACLILSGIACADDFPVASQTAPPERIVLWNGRAPVGGGAFEEGEAWITVHRPVQGNGAAVVICPGGGYAQVVKEPEGHGIARWLNQNGITGVVLEYRLPAGRTYVPLLDAQRALRTVRTRAKDWGVDPQRIGIMGFSAGGHLASTAGTHFDGGNSDASDPIERVGCRPDFMILVYPVISMGEATHSGSRTNLLGKDPSAELVKFFSNEQQVNGQTPPTFLAHAVDDKPVPPENSRAFLAALQKAKVPAKYLELPSGGHGLDGYKGPMWDAWQEQSLAWLAERKFVPQGNLQKK